MYSGFFIYTKIAIVRTGIVIREQKKKSVTISEFNYI